MANIVRVSASSYYIVSKCPKPIFEALVSQAGTQDRALREVRYRWETLVQQLFRELAERNLSGGSTHPPGDPGHAP
jgi:hypothetical protein